MIIGCTEVYCGKKKQKDVSEIFIPHAGERKDVSNWKDNSSPTLLPVPKVSLQMPAFAFWIVASCPPDSPSIALCIFMLLDHSDSLVLHFVPEFYIFSSHKQSLFLRIQEKSRSVVSCILYNTRIYFFSG